MKMTEQLGLDTDDLNELSLGNWNSIFKGNKLFLSGNLLEKYKNLSGIEVKFRTSPPKQGTRVLVWRYTKKSLKRHLVNILFYLLKALLLNILVSMKE